LLIKLGISNLINRKIAPAILILVFVLILNSFIYNKYSKN